MASNQKPPPTPSVPLQAIDANAANTGRPSDMTAVSFASADARLQTPASAASTPAPDMAEDKVAGALSLIAAEIADVKEHNKSYTKQIKELESDKVLLSYAVERLESEKSRLDSDVNNSTSELKGHRQQIEKLKSDIDELESHNNNLQEANHRLESENIAKLEGKRQQINTLQSENEELLKENEAAGAKNLKLTQEIGAATQSIRSLEAQVAAERSTNEKLAEEYRQVRSSSVAEAAKLRKIIKQLKEEISDLQSDYDRLAEEKSDLRQQLEAGTVEIADLTKRNMDLEAETKSKKAALLREFPSFIGTIFDDGNRVPSDRAGGDDGSERGGGGGGDGPRPDDNGFPSSNDDDPNGGGVGIGENSPVEHPQNPSSSDAAMQGGKGIGDKEAPGRKRAGLDDELEVVEAEGSPHPSARHDASIAGHETKRKRGKARSSGAAGDNDDVFIPIEVETVPPKRRRYVMDGRIEGSESPNDSDAAEHECGSNKSFDAASDSAGVNGDGNNDEGGGSGNGPRFQDNDSDDFPLSDNDDDHGEVNEHSNPSDGGKFDDQLQDGDGGKLTDDGDLQPMLGNDEHIGDFDEEMDATNNNGDEGVGTGSGSLPSGQLSETTSPESEGSNDGFPLPDDADLLHGDDNEDYDDKQSFDGGDSPSSTISTDDVQGASGKLPRSAGDPSRSNGDALISSKKKGRALQRDEKIELVKEYAESHDLGMIREGTIFQGFNIYFNIYEIDKSLKKLHRKHITYANENSKTNEQLKKGGGDFLSSDQIRQLEDIPGYVVNPQKDHFNKMCVEAEAIIQDNTEAMATDEVVVSKLKAIGDTSKWAETVWRRFKVVYENDKNGAEDVFAGGRYFTGTNQNRKDVLAKRKRLLQEYHILNEMGFLEIFWKMEQSKKDPKRKSEGGEKAEETEEMIEPMALV